LNGFGDRDQIEATRNALAQKHKVNVRSSAADMSRPDEIRAVAAYARTEFGKVDIIVNSAGIQHVAPLEDFPD